MRIISPFKDYYDNSLGYVEVDGEDIYIRKTECDESKDYSFALENVNNSRSGEFYKTPMLWRNYSIEPPSIVDRFGISAMYVVVCGKIYPCLVQKKYPGDCLDVFYTPEAYFKARNDFIVSKKINTQQRSWEERIEKMVEKFFSAEAKESFTDWCVENKIITAILFAPSVKRSVILEVNPKLSDYKFQKKMDGHILYQEINMFLGRLCSPEKVPVELTEKERINQHGFDKWSFRKMPSK
jgi:hypothetical protein